MYSITRDYISKGNARPGTKLVGGKPKFIVSHDIGNGSSTAYNNRTYFNREQPSASAHTFIDDKVILEIIPLDEKAWHVIYNVPTDNVLFGDDANDIAIGVELCWGGKIVWKEAYQRYVWYHAHLCKTFGLDPHKHIVPHSKLDPERKSDPDKNAFAKHGVTWSQFINDVATVLNPPINGWLKESCKWFFYKNGKKHTGWIKDKNKWYYLDAAGVMQTGWVKVKGKWYFLKSNGEMAQGWVKDKGKWYYLNPAADRGEMLADTVIQDKGRFYYLNKDGSMVENESVNVKLKAGKDGSLMP